MRPETKARYPKNWEQRAAQIINRRGSFCRHCGRTPKDRIILTVHHKNYDPADGRPSNLRVLCQGCHLKFQASQTHYLHGRYVLVPDDLRQLKIPFPRS